MNIFNSVEFKVGLLVVVVAALVAVMSIRVSDDPSYIGSSRMAWFVVDDASGLVKNSGIKMAGINIGVIDDIRLQNGLARVDMSIQGNVPLTKSARIEIRANGILGDKHVEVIAGGVNDIPLENGGQIINVEDRGSMDALLTQVGKISTAVGDVADTMRGALQGDGNTQDSLGRVVRNLENLTADISEMAAENKKDIRSIVKKFKGVSDTLDDLVNDDSEEGFKAAWSNAANSLSRIDRTLQSAEEIADKINSGEGTLGRLIHDEETVEGLNQAIEGVNNVLGSSYRLQTSVDFYTNYYSTLDRFKSNLGVKIQPGLDRYYFLGIVDDPVGVKETIETERTTTPGNSENTVETKTFKSKVKLNAFFAKNFYDFTLKGGLMENTGGVGFDYYFLRQRLRFSVDALSFSKVDLRWSAKLDLYKGIYIHGGEEDLLSKNEGRSNYFGLGMFFTNDDLKLLATGVSF